MQLTYEKQIASPLEFVMLLSTHRSTAAMFVCALTAACAQDVPAPALDTVATTMPPSSALSALPMIASAVNNVQAVDLFVDPGAQFSMDTGPATLNNPNQHACEAALAQLTGDQAQLRRTNEWQALLNSVAYGMVSHDIQQVRSASCHSAITATGRCQKDIGQLNNTIALLWRSPEYLALQQTAEYVVLQSDANAIAGIGLVWRRCAEAKLVPSVLPAIAHSVERAKVLPKYEALAKYDAGQPSVWSQSPRLAANVVEARHHARRHRHHHRGWSSRI